MEREDEIIIILKEKGKEEERYIGERRESSKSLSIDMPFWPIYTII